MKTQFAKLLSAKQQQLSLCEQQIARYKSAITAKQEQVTALIKQISLLQIPQSGDFHLVLQANARKKGLVFEIDALQERIAEDRAQIQELEARVRLLYVELEKFRHLRDAAREQQLRLLKQKERRELDEIAILLHNKEQV